MKNQKVNVLAYEWLPENRKHIETALADSSHITFENDPRSFQKEINKRHYDIIFMNVRPDNGATFTLLKATHKNTPYTPIIITSAFEHSDLAVEALRYGASDVITDPFIPARIQFAVQKAIQARSQDHELAYLRRTQDVLYNFDNLIAESPRFKAVLETLRKFAASDSTLLLTGKTGTGKSFLSGTIHFNSARRDKPFIKINCANIPEALLESELFGHEKGAFTGADKQRIGRFEQADGGTIFLDEIGEMTLGLQAKLLRVLEEKSFERVGGNKTVQVDVRLIAATNRNLAAQIEAGAFREDLFYRINVLPVELPSLSERPLCIAPLAKALLTKTAASACKNILGFTPEALALIESKAWPGNIRQLANTVERAVILEDSQWIRPETLQLGGEPVYIPATGKKVQALEDHERALVLRALKECGWVQKKAAKRLGVSPRVMNYKIQKFGILHPSWRKNKAL